MSFAFAARLLATVAPVSGARRSRSPETGQTVQALVALGFAAWIGASIAGDRASTLNAAVTYVIILICSVVLHEGAHALVVRWIGGQVAEIQLGFGPTLLDRVVHRVRIVVKPLVIAGHVGWQPPAGARRGQLIAVSAAGLVVHLVLVVVAVASGTGSWPVWRIDLLIANVFALVSNTVPSVTSLTTTAGGPNDGAHLRALLRQEGADDGLGDEVRRLQAVFVGQLAAGPAVRSAEVIGALESIDRLAGVSTVGGSALYPAVLHTRALADLCRGNFVRAEQVTARTLAQLPNDAHSAQARALSTLGWAALGQGRRGDAALLLHRAVEQDDADPVVLALGRALGVPAG